MKKNITMYASNFSGYGEIQEMKSTLSFLARDAGIRFNFVNDPHRTGNQIKVNWNGINTISEPMSAKEINEQLNKLGEE